MNSLDSSAAEQFLQSHGEVEDATGAAAGSRVEFSSDYLISMVQAKIGGRIEIGFVRK